LALNVFILKIFLNHLHMYYSQMLTLAMHSCSNDSLAMYICTYLCTPRLNYL
jgi:hypothetical protein